MNEVDLLRRRISLEAILLAGVVCGLSLALKQARFAFGLLVGTLVSILNFKLLANRLVGSFKLIGSRVFFNLFSSLLFRFGIMGLVLWAAINKGLDLFFGASVGLFMVKFAIYIDTFLVPGRWKA